MMWVALPATVIEDLNPIQAITGTSLLGAVLVFGISGLITSVQAQEELAYINPAPWRTGFSRVGSHGTAADGHVGEPIIAPACWIAFPNWTCANRKALSPN